MHRVLIVEDDEGFRLLLLKKLIQLGIDAEGVGTGAEAIRRVGEQSGLILMLDQNLPDMKGLHLLETLSRQVTTVPFIVMTGHGDERLAVEMMKMGALDYLVKDTNFFDYLPGTLDRVFRIVETEQRLRETEKSLYQHQAMLRLILDTVPHAIFWKDLQGVYLGCNQVFSKACGLADPSLIRGKTDRDLPWSASDTEGYLRDDADILRSGMPKRHIVESIQQADGTRVCVETSKMPLLDQEHKLSGILGIYEDVTERKRKEEERERLITAIEQSGETIFITDPAGKIQYVNPAFTTVTGYLREEVLGKTPRILKSGKHADSFYRELWQTISSGRTWEGQIINKRKDGTFYTEEATISPVLDEQGTIISYVAVKRDVSDHLRLAEQLQQSQKMESVGRLAGGIAHDFNNLLMAIMGSAELCFDLLSPEDPIRKELTDILTAGERAATLTRQLLAFARKEVISPHVLNINETVVGMLTLLQRMIGEDIRIIWRPGVDLWPVKLDPAQIDQILANLCVNARDAIDTIGTIIIETDNVALTAEDQAGFSTLDATPGDYVRLSISDNGCGMNEEIRRHLFEPFFTTKKMGKGTGLGLATVYGIVRQNHGFIEVKSVLGQGSEFAIFLPRFQGPITVPATNGHPLPPVGGMETLLLVEDEPAVCEATRRFLMKAGYTVLAAYSAEQAWQLMNDFVGEISLLLTDVVMPGLSGPDLARQIKARHPKIKCLFMSGYTAEIIAKHGILEDGIEFLAKPFTRDDLIRRVRQVLDRRGERCPC